MADNACCEAPVLGAVGGVDLDANIGGIVLHENYIFIDTACLNVTFVEHLDAAEQGGIAAINRSDIEVVAKADNPNRYRISHSNRFVFRFLHPKTDCFTVLFDYSICQNIAKKRDLYTGQSHLTMNRNDYPGLHKSIQKGASYRMLRDR
jgi:hypothetical protein